MTDRVDWWDIVMRWLGGCVMVLSGAATVFVVWLIFDAMRWQNAPNACEGSAGPVVHPTVWPKRGDPVRPGALPAAVDGRIPDSVRVGR